MEENTVITPEQKKMKMRVFASRLTGYLILGLFIPFAFLVWRFNLFQETDKLNIGGWGIVAIIFSSVFVAKLAGQAIECTDNFFIKQIIRAFKNVLIPLLAVTLCIYAVGDFWKELIHFFIILTICEPIAYVLNPFPEFIREKKKEKEESKILKIIGFFWDNKKE